MFYLNDGWYRMVPTPEQTLPPTIMKPMTRPTWQYKNPGSLAASGIYSDKDLEHLRDHIMFPAEKSGILNAMARGAKGEPTISQGLSLSHLLDEDSIKRITENTWKKIWGKFITFGNASAGVIGVYFFIRVIKLIMDTVIHGYAIHTIYGWSLHLLGSFWDSITHLIILLSQRKSKKKEAPEEEAAEELNTLQENPNVADQEPNTEISIETRGFGLYPRL